MLNYNTIDEYIAAQPDDRKLILQQFRKIIKKAAPEAEEIISYGMPAFKYHTVLVYFAASKTHYGFYPTSKPIEVFKDKLRLYKTSKGAIHFPVDEPLPEKLITEIVKYRLKEVAHKKESKDSITSKKATAEKSGKK